MPLVIPENHYQCLVPIRHQLLNRSAAITFGIRVEPGTENPSEVADDVTVALSSSLGDVFDADCTIGPTILTFDQAGVRGSVSGSASFTGNAARPISTSPNVAVLVRKTTNRVGRPGRGRLFLPWALAAAEVSEVGVIAGSAFNPLQEQLDDVLPALDTQREGMVMVVLHDEDVPGGPTPSLVTALNLQNVVATQRRRLRS